jgi:hypothetical protein
MARGLDEGIAVQEAGNNTDSQTSILNNRKSGTCDNQSYKAVPGHINHGVYIYGYQKKLERAQDGAEEQ